MKWLGGEIGKRKALKTPRLKRLGSSSLPRASKVLLRGIGMAQMKKTQIIKEIIGFYERNPLLRATTSYGYCIYYGIGQESKKTFASKVQRIMLDNEQWL